jgi:predicted dehydrogenase
MRRTEPEEAKTMSSPSPSPVRVGIVGANRTRGWAAAAHLPALALLPEFEVTAVATTKEESAKEAAEAFGILSAFGAHDLIARADVDLVAVTVRVPAHAEVVRAAVAAGKHVLSEWPLGVDLGEAISLAGQATSAGVVHAVGLQGVHAPGARFVADLIAEGRIGRLESVSVVAPGGLGGKRIPESLAWTADPAAGVTVLSITGGHILATLAQTVGPLEQLSAVATNLNQVATIVETGATIPVGTPNQVGLVGTLVSGAVVSITLQGGAPAASAGFLLQIVGSDGALVIRPAQPGGALHIGDWAIEAVPAEGPAEGLAVPDRYRVIPPEVPAGPPANVAALYLEVALAIAEQRQPHPSFDTAVQYHQLLAAIERAAQTGTRQPVGRAQPAPSGSVR